MTGVQRRSEPEILEERLLMSAMVMKMSETLETVGPSARTFSTNWIIPRSRPGVPRARSSISGVTAGKSRVLRKSITSSARFELKMVVRI